MSLVTLDYDGVTAARLFSSRTKAAGRTDAERRSFVGGHLVHEAPDDLREIEAGIDAEPRRRRDAWARRSIIFGLTLFWGGVAYAFVA